MGLDCEMNEGIGRNVLCRVSMVNQRGELVMDTLVKAEEGQTRKSLKGIHGIEEDELVDAPPEKDVLIEIQRLTSLLPDIIWVGHSIRHDLSQVHLYEAMFIDTQCS